MAPIDPSQPPIGVGGYSDAKPRFHPAQPTYYDRPGQLGLHTQQGYSQPGGISPAPQDSYQSAYNTTAYLYNGNARETKYEGTNGTAELGGDDSEISPGTIPVSELSGVDAKRSVEGIVGNDKTQ